MSKKFNFSIKKMVADYRQLAVVAERDDGFEIQFKVKFDEHHMPEVEEALKVLVDAISKEVAKGI